MTLGRGNPNDKSHSEGVQALTKLQAQRSALLSLDLIQLWGSSVILTFQTRETTQVVGSGPESHSHQPKAKPGASPPLSPASLGLRTHYVKSSAQDPVRIQHMLSYSILKATAFLLPSLLLPSHLPFKVQFKFISEKPDCSWKDEGKALLLATAALPLPGWLSLLLHAGLFLGASSHRASLSPVPAARHTIPSPRGARTTRHLSGIHGIFYQTKE